MNAETIVAQPIEQQVAEWSATAAEIVAQVAATEGITVHGYLDEDGTPNPKRGREAVHRAMMDLVVVRTGIEARRKALKAPILALGTLVDSEAKRLTALAQPREKELAADRDAYDAEQARIEAERIAQVEAEARRIAEEEQARIQAIADQIVDLGGRPNFAWLALASESAVAELLAGLASEKSQRDEAERIAQAQKAEAEAEAERVAQIQREQEAREAEARRIEREAQEAELAESRERIRLEATRIKAENDAREAAFRADLAKLTAEREAYEAKLAQDEAARQAEARRVREEAEAEARMVAAEQAAKAEAERIEAERPDREKALGWLSALIDAIPEIPEIGSVDILHSLVVVKSDIIDIVRTAQIGSTK